jgi:hypothetical protein
LTRSTLSCAAAACVFPDVDVVWHPWPELAPWSYLTSPSTATLRSAFWAIFGSIELGLMEELSEEDPGGSFCFDTTFEVPGNLTPNP